MGNRGGLPTHPRGEYGRISALQHVFQLLTGRGPAGCGWECIKSCPLQGARSRLVLAKAPPSTTPLATSPTPRLLWMGPISPAQTTSLATSFTNGSILPTQAIYAPQGPTHPTLAPAPYPGSTHGTAPPAQTTPLATGHTHHHFRASTTTTGPACGSNPPAQTASLATSRI